MEHLISEKLLYQAILSGAEQTRERREELNRINVFPVVDNDTGSNLAYTMQYILANASLFGNVRHMLLEVSRSALYGARGNSGAIFSQYFNGLYENSAEKEMVTLSELSDYFQKAYQKAYEALDVPVEGTIITLMRTWAASVAKLKDCEASLLEIFEGALKDLGQSLKETTKTLQVLKDLHIVDAGALGFYVFIEGFVKVITGQHQYIHNKTAAMPLPLEAPDIHDSGVDAEFPYRYCTEVLLETGGKQAALLKDALRELGDCLLVCGAEDLTRVHLHTNEPWTVVHIAASRGKILEHKVDDMVFQHRMASGVIGEVACVTDSIADLPRSFVQEHDIFQIPINIMIDGHSYEDKVTMDGAFLYENMDKASSAQLNTRQVVEFLKPILACYRRVIIFTVSSKMSGTYDRFKEALKELDPRGLQATLIDTKTNSGAQGLLVWKAVEMLSSGISPQETVERLYDLRRKVRILVSLPDIRPMVQSGRISEKVGRVLIFLGFRPLITIDGEGQGRIKGAAFTKCGNRRLLFRTLRKALPDTYVVVHGHDESAAAEVSRELVDIAKKQPVYVSPISAVVALFAGKGSVAVAYFESR